MCCFSRSAQKLVKRNVRKYLADMYRSVLLLGKRGDGEGGNLGQSNRQEGCAVRGKMNLLCFVRLLSGFVVYFSKSTKYKV